MRHRRSGRNEIELGRLLDRNAGRLRPPPQNLVNQVGSATEQVREVWPIGHQCSRFNHFPLTVNRRQSCGERQSDAVREHKEVGTNIKCLRRLRVSVQG